MAERLAIDGGRPVRETFLPFFRPSVGEEEIAEVAASLRSGWLTTGPRVRRFEEEFAGYVGASHAVAVNSCTAALHLSLAVIGVGPGDEVIVPAYTFAATAEVVTYSGARPVLADVDPSTANLRARDAAAAITPRTRAVIPVHFAGRACDIEAIRNVADDAGIEVVEDAAHALPARVGDRLIGSDGRFVCFSFYATKNLTTGEGGMLTTTDPEVADRARLLSLHGMSRDAWNRYAEEGSWYYEVVEAGFKYNLTDLAASVGLAQLRKLPSLHRERVAQAERYMRAFAGLPWLEAPRVEAPSSHAWHLFVVRLNLERLRCDRARFIAALRAENIGASVHFIPLHLHPYYRERYGYEDDDFPNAMAFYRGEVSLPLYPAMSARDQQDVIAAVLKIGAACAR